jgi:hypothetical protein
MADAVVHIGPFPNQDRARPLIRRFYERCALEVVGPGRVSTGDIKVFDTLEELIDNITGRRETFQVVVAHGDPKHGMIIPFTAEGPARANATGLIIDRLASLVKSWSPSNPLGVTSPFSSLGGSAPDPTLVGLAVDMDVSLAVVGRLVGKLAALKPVILELRGCHLAENGNLGLLTGYKNAFKALSVSGPDGRMFYVSVLPHTPKSPQTMGALATVTLSGRTRRRVFRDDTTPALSQAGPLILDVHDIDGHTQVDTDAFMSQPAQNGPWAQAINGAWNGPAADGFVTQVIWQDKDTKIYHTPWQVSYRSHIQRV